MGVTRFSPLFINIFEGEAGKTKALGKKKKAPDHKIHGAFVVQSGVWVAFSNPPTLSLSLSLCLYFMWEEHRERKHWKGLPKGGDASRGLSVRRTRIRGLQVSTAQKYMQ